MKVSLDWVYSLLLEDDEIAEAIWEYYENLPCCWRGYNEEDL